MRIEHSVTTISWIPSEAVDGARRSAASRLGVAHYDSAPPDALGARRRRGAATSSSPADRFRFANHLRAWRRGRRRRRDRRGRAPAAAADIGVDHAAPGRATSRSPRWPCPTCQAEPEVGDGWVRFTQTAGGRTGVPMPRPVRRRRSCSTARPIAWTTLELTIHRRRPTRAPPVGVRRRSPATGSTTPTARWSAKTGLTDLKEWAGNAFGKHTPWGDEDSPAFVTEVETALERELSTLSCAARRKPEIRTLQGGRASSRARATQATSCSCCSTACSSSTSTASRLAEVGPGAVLGERALLEGGRRTSTLRARTPCRVAVVPAEQIDRDELAELATGHRPATSMAVTTTSTSRRGHAMAPSA